MLTVVAEFFNIIGVDAVPPETMSELIPYLLIVFVGLMLVLGVFQVISNVARAFASFRGV